MTILKCDYCGAETEKKGVRGSLNNYPVGWGTVNIASTNDTEKKDICPRCVKTINFCKDCRLN